MSYIEDEIEYSTKQISENPDDAENYAGRGEAYSLGERYSEALADYNQAILLDPTTAWYYKARAGVHLQLQNHEESIADYTTALRLAPDDVEFKADIYYFRASQYRWLENIEASIADYTARMEVKPQDRSHDLMRRAYMRRMNNDLQGAMQDARESFALDFSRSDAMALIAMCKSELGDLEGAEADYTEAIHLNPGYPAHYLMLRAEIRLKKGDITGANHDRDEVLRLAPEREGLSVIYIRAKENLTQGHFEDALEQVNSLLMREPEHFSYLILRGDIYRGQQKIEDAKKDYNLAIQKLDEYIPYHDSSKPAQGYQLVQLYKDRGDTQAGLGHIDAAIKDYKQVLELKKRFPSIPVDIAPLEEYIENHQNFS